MGIIVQKFGGSSVANVEKLELVAGHIIKEVEKGNKVVVVVSAQGKTTDKLISEEAEITENPDKREHEVLVTTGEQITISKLAMLLIDKNYKAVSLTGWQIPIITNSEFTNARIRYIHNETIENYLNSGNIVVVAGFQGVDENGNITTLGRGGSDTTAVALAASLGAERCDIFTDVDGIFTTDPRIVEKVKKFEEERADASADAVIKKGLATPAQKKVIKEWCLKDPEGFTEYFDNAKPIIQIDPKPQSQKVNVNEEAMVDYFKK